MATRYLSSLGVGVALSLFSFLFHASAAPYTIIKESDTSIGTQRHRENITILAPKATDKASRAETVNQVISDKIKDSSVEVVTVFLIPSKGLLDAGALLAKGEYYSDGCGSSGNECGGKNLFIAASDVKLSNQEIKVWEQSIKSSNELAEKGIFDDEKITADVAKKLKIKPSDVTVPYIELESVIAK